MNRQEQIEAATATYINGRLKNNVPPEEIEEIRLAYQAGAIYADEHPNEGLVSIDKVCEYLANHIDKDLVIYNDYTWLKRDEFIEKLKKEINK